MKLRSRTVSTWMCRTHADEAVAAVRDAVALELQLCGMRGSLVIMAERGEIGVGRGADGTAWELGAAVRRASTAYKSLEDRLVEVGGITPVVALYDRIMGEMERLEYAELDRVATDIRDAIEALLRMDVSVRKLNNLKVMFDRARHAGTAADGE